MLWQRKLINQEAAHVTKDTLLQNIVSTNSKKCRHVKVETARNTKWSCIPAKVCWHTPCTSTRGPRSKIMPGNQCRECMFSDMIVH